MANNKFIKVNHYGPILPLSGIQGPIKTPMILGYGKISELVDLGYDVIECIKNMKTNEFIGEVKLTRENYNRNNFSVVSKQNSTDDGKHQNASSQEIDTVSEPLQSETIDSKETPALNLNEGVSEDQGLSETENRSSAGEVEEAIVAEESEHKASEEEIPQQSVEEESTEEEVATDEVQSGKKKKRNK